MKHNYSSYKVFLAGVLLAFVFNCKKDIKQLMPTLTLVSVTNITSTTATGGGEVTADGGSTILSRGVCWSTGSDPTISDSKVAIGTGSGTFTGNITGLSPGTTYYIRAYATNNIGTGYSSASTFSALAVTPLLTTLDATSVTASSVSSGGNVTTDGGSDVKARGVCWSTHLNPTISDSITINGLGLGTYSSSITGLSPGVTYYIRAYAINLIGTAYGNQVTITTAATIPTISTTSVMAFTATTASSGGMILSDGGAAITARGVCWSLSQNPTVADSKTSDGTGASSFSSSISGLTPGSTYFIRAYATNNMGTAYGNQIITTTTAILPVLSTTAVSTITSTSATSGGNISNNGGSIVTTRGICWSTSQNPTIGDSKNPNGTGSGSFSGTLTGLTPGATYYIRAYATNIIGTAYGNQVNTTTTAVVPTVSTNVVMAFSSTTASSGGIILSDGGADITARGVCWSVNQNPTFADSKTNDGTGTSNYTSSLTGLTPGTIYYIRAYATNSAGTAYGDAVSTITTAVLPSLTTSAGSAITSTTTTSGGVIASDGGATVLAKGICWATTHTPTVANSKTTDGSGATAYTSAITGLTPGTIYYIRAYATNSIGTAYGNEVTITTIAYPPALITTILTAITSTTATGGGNVSSDGGAAVTARGVCWNTSSNPSILDSKTSNSTGTGTFVSALTGLAPGTTYYVRAYATNSIGTSYGNEVNGITTAVLPLITTSAVTGLTSTAATCGGTISSDGGAAVSARGVCWSLSQNPTTADSKTVTGTGTGSFTSSITGLTPGTTYYIRAYATNSIGTVYGNQITTITTIDIPVLTTTAVSGITSSGGASGGTITSNGGATITLSGICWSVNQGPTIADSKTTNGTSTGGFASSVSGVNSSTTYYVRAYATNSSGTAYGNQVSFTTSALVIGQAYQGGIIAYIYVVGDPGYVAGETHGLIAAPADQPTGIWGCYGYDQVGANGVVLGTGNQNTIDIMAGCAAAGIAARECGDLVLGGYSDWYLPSKDELYKLFLNAGAIGGFVANTYWCSTEYNLIDGWKLNFGNGSWSSNSSKLNAQNVRPVRSF